MATNDRDTLSRSVKPSHYAIDLFGLELGGNFSYDGTVAIDIQTDAPLQKITLNAAELSVKSANLAGHKAALISYDKGKQRVELDFLEEIAPGSSTLTIAFSGLINHDMAGFYRSLYKSTAPASEATPIEGDHHVMFSTQFESCDARRAFPCFDEPNLKATFDFSIEIPDKLTALSNMPEKIAKPGGKQGLKVVQFERTPIMSTYLLAWAVGDFEYLEAETERTYNGKPLPVRVYTTRGLKDRGNLGLQVCRKVVDYYSDIFQLEYPLPKIDLLAVHEFSHGAMENWGLITYRTTAILFDEKQSDARYKNRVSYVVAHELAHQWFGNLVTMDWWNELWLNEGFATWVGWLAIDHQFPDYKVWSQFVTESMQMALNLDSLPSSHPIEVPVRDALEVDQIFDAISYQKGSSVIRMLSAHLGVEVFLRGVSAYLKKHAYGNATTSDLWTALSEASGQDVSAFMTPWISKIGYPVLTVAEEPGQLGVRQSRFLSSGSVKSDDDQTLWWLPLGLKSGTSIQEAKKQALTAKEETLRDIDETFYKVNADQVGFYRTNYPPARLVKLGQERSRLSDEDKIGLIADAAALAVAGEGTTAGLLALVESFSEETSHHVWAQVISALGNVRSVFADNEAISAGLSRFTLKLISQAVERVGWTAQPNEGFLDGQLRALLISAAGGCGHEGVISKAREQFDNLQSGNDEAIHPSLRLAVFRTIIGEGSKSDYEAVKTYYGKTTSIDGKEICLVAMGRVTSPELINDFMDFQFSDAVAAQDKHSGSISLATNGKARKTLWTYLKNNWGKVMEALGGRMIIMDRYLKSTLSKFADHEIEQDIAAFFKDKDTKGYDRGLIQVADSVRANANYRERDEAVVLEWLKAHGYAK